MKLERKYIDQVKALQEQHEKSGNPTASREIVFECDQIWPHLPESLRSLADMMIAESDRRGSEVVASFEDYDVLGRLNDYEQATLARLISLRTNRRAIFLTGRFTVYPRTAIVAGRALAQQETKHFGLTRKRKQKPTGNVRSQTILGQTATA